MTHNADENQSNDRIETKREREKKEHNNNDNKLIKGHFFAACKALN